LFIRSLKISLRVGSAREEKIESSDNVYSTI
jgi:hypothetical protein